MKFLTLSIIIICLMGQATAQTDSLHKAFLDDKCGKVHLHLMPKAKKSKTPPYFSNFEVVDFRPDTSRIGLWTANKTRRELLFNSTASNTLATYLNTCYTDPSATQSFLILIKKLWLYDTIKVYGKGVGRIHFRVEIFLKTKEGLAPYTYLDTLITSHISVLDMGGFKLAALMAVLVNKISSTDEAAVGKRRRLYSFQQLDSMNNKRFSYPMDTATILNPGVYASIEEFRNNQPSILNYEIQPDENGLMQLYLKDEQGKSYFSRKMWGYCDGKNCYVMMNGNLFPVLFIDHAFYVWGSKEFRRKTKQIPIILPFPPAIMFGTMTVSETAVRQMSIFTLDPYAGDIY
jgi:hypothetical protein